MLKINYAFNKTFNLFYTTSKVVSTQTSYLLFTSRIYFNS